MSEDGVSDYEKLRLANIARNEAALAQLAIPKLSAIPVAKRKPASKKRQRPAASEGAGRRSSRIAAAPRRTMKDGGDHARDDSDYEDDHGGDDADSDTEPRIQRRRTAVPKQAQQAAPVVLPPPGEQTDVVTVELAKTGRSKCRGCFEPIAAGSPRVGMAAWIMGRSSMTWSHPHCCVNRLIVAVEASGRGKCKLTGAPLQKGAPKLGVRSHTATSWVAMPGAANVLAPVLRVVVAAERERVNAALGAAGAPPTIEGYSELPEEHAATVRTALQAATTGDGAAAKADSGTPPQSEQRTSASSQKLTGKVAWKFGGATCYGTMIPASETETHCYATTHKGNVKTLAKGKTYWWLLKNK